MAIKFIRIAVLYALLGIGIGIYMAASHDFAQRDTHAHANLLGWVSLALSGLIYQAFPYLAEHVLATVHFWSQNIGLPITLIGIALIYGGNPGLGEPFAGIGSTIVAVGFIALAINLFRTAPDGG
jgi:cbb3-type cytochrome oxidase subunit 1